MTDNSMLAPPGGPASPAHGQARPRSAGPALLTAALIVAGSLLVGVAGGAIWSAAAPRVLYQVYTLNPPTAYATNPETSAFIAADGWYCFIALVCGALIGLLGYLFGVRRYGPLPMAGIVVGSIGAAFVAAWIGHWLSGGPGFDHLLATSRPGSFLHAPISLGARGGLAFWPLAAAGVAGGIELIGVLKARHQAPYDEVPMPGMETFGSRPALGRAYPGRHSASQQGASQQGAGQPGAGQPGAGQPGAGQPGAGHQGAGQQGMGQPGASGQDLRWPPSGEDQAGGSAGRVAP
jgi:hypothetical protein